MNLKENTVLVLHVISLLVVEEYVASNNARSVNSQMCINLDNTVRAKHKSCLLRPDTGPCRADIISWYFDAKQENCYRFFYGGCQGNGNRYPSKIACLNYCYVNASIQNNPIPHFCSLAFDYGHCFGQYNRWGWDPLFKTCRRRLYSGCGGNQNNFETRSECLATCVTGPNNTLSERKTFTTCIPFTIPET
ncbi:kunitz-type serine protease inhibitor A-like [Spodoptera litura]|uniref:Kunitz-type serine protease inhibitor A-like n=1 Tax=Spodoptera litura TaxID=69820 RepID=A0A9J7J1U5_SPOLT|nr:kunitz-type serine protease inhibitor A-like [Spodoptera litura]